MMTARRGYGLYYGDILGLIGFRIRIGLELKSLEGLYLMDSNHLTFDSRVYVKQHFLTTYHRLIIKNPR
jgi:hypothetical protein